MINQDEFRLKEELSIADNSSLVKDRVKAQFKLMMELYKEISKMMR